MTEQTKFSEQEKLVAYKKFYSNPKVFELMNQFMFNREVIFAGDKYWFRSLRANNIDEFNAIKKRYGLMNWLGNVFFTFATLNEMPRLSFDADEKKEQNKIFIGKFNSLISKLDFGLDFDAKEFSIELVREEVKRVVDFITTAKFKKFVVKCSGSGMHIDIPYKKEIIRGNIKNFNDLISFHCDFCVMLKDICRLKTLDTKIYDLRRMWKCPFSFDIKSGNIALPLENNEIESFNYDTVWYKNVDDDVLFRRNKIYEKFNEIPYDIDLQDVWKFWFGKNWGSWK